MLSSSMHFSPEERLSDRWRRHAAAFPQSVAVTHWVAGSKPVHWRWGELLCSAQNVAHWLSIQGVRPGQVCALILRHHPWFYPVYLGISLSGALPAVLAYPNARTHPDKFRQGLEGMARRSGLDWVLSERELEPIIRDLMLREGSTIQGLLFPLEFNMTTQTQPYMPLSPIASAESPCLLQHSSGTTGLQKAVVLSHRAVLGHIERYHRAIGLKADDKIVSWLPLYHDMGLIAAFHMALACAIPLIQLDPFEWVQAPVLLLEAVAHERATLTWLPNFAYHLMAERIHEEDLKGLRFDRMRMFINCSEPVRAEAHEKFLRRFGPYGVRAEMLAACYAMAETTFAVTQTIPGQPASQLTVDRSELACGRVRPTSPGPQSRVCVSSGFPIADCTVRVVNDQGEDLPDDQVGELVIRSASMFDGYRNYPEKTAEVLKDGWYYSGDYGFRHQGEYYVIGRKKDLIIVAGKNIYPEDIEDVINGVPGVIPGRVVAFGMDDLELGTEQVAVVVESEHHGTSRVAEIRRGVVQAGMEIGVTISAVYVVPPRWLIKSSAGKPSRKANRERVLNELKAQE
jgi:fatty-acyl-CoA synthase